MTPAEIPQFLAGYSFKELTLSKHEAASYTFKFGDYNHNALLKALGEPTITADKKTLIFSLPGVGKIGVAPAVHVVRFIDANPTSRSVPTSHLSIMTTTKELEFAYVKAQATPRLRLAFLKKAFAYFNKEKFQDRLHEPVLQVGATPPRKAPHLKNARGIYYGGLGGPNGTLWIAEMLFNAEMPFFSEVFAHEMCHQAVATIDHVRDNSEGGHGPNWQTWMRHCGLDPRRFDPTDDTTYKTSSENAQSEEKYESAYGPKAKPAEIKRVSSLPHPTAQQISRGVEVYYVTHGRVLEGKIIGRNFSYKNNRGGSSNLVWNALPAPTTFFLKD